MFLKTKAEVENPSIHAKFIWSMWIDVIEGDIEVASKIWEELALIGCPSAMRTWALYWKQGLI